jgi:hypothetical protein
LASGCWAKPEATVSNVAATSIALEDFMMN